jgi:hypothetical protein
MTTAQQNKATAVLAQHALYTRNILSVYYSASLLDHQQGISWYAAAAEMAGFIARTYGLSLYQAAGILAAISPQQEWGRNVAMAERLVATYCLTGQSAASQGGYLGTGLRKVDALLALPDPSPAQVCTILKGDKVSAFFSNIAGDLTQVCVDGHATNIAKCGMLRRGISQAKSLTSLQYRLASAAYTAAADEAGVEPAVMQAITWVAYKGLVLVK